MRQRAFLQAGALFGALVVACAPALIAPVWAQTAPATESIADVLERSHAQRLAAFEPVTADAPAARAMQAQLARLLLQDASEPGVPLRVVRGGMMAEAMQGRMIVAGDGLAEMAPQEQLFILAHELGHIRLGHWAQMKALYLHWVPGAVTPQTTDPVARELGRAASALSHQQEHEADAFALRLLHSMGVSREVATAVFQRAGARQGTATHPSTVRRVAALRAVDLQDGAAPALAFKQAP